MVNTRDPQLYEHLSLIVQAYEERAIQSGKRQGFMVAAKGPLVGFEQILAGTDKILADSERRSQPRRDAASTGRLRVEAEGSLTNPDTDFQLSLETDPIEADFNVDLLDLLADEGPVGDFTARYLGECLGCDARLQFGWQLKPMNLLGTLDKLLDGMESSIDRFKARLDPLTQLTGLCNLLNSFRVFCIQDILMILMSIKMLIKRYMQNTLRIRLDWTSILGPLLKVVLDGVANLIGDAAAIITAPLDCAGATLKVADQIYRETREMVNDLSSLATVGATSVDAQLGINMRNVQIKDGRVQTQDSVSPFPGTLQEQNQRSGERFSTPGTNFFTGLSLDAKMTTADALKQSNFNDASPIQKILIPLNEAKQWILDEVEKINRAVRSLGTLTGGGLEINLDNLGVLLFLTDIVGLIGLIIRMVRTGNRQTDWCRVLADNPGMLEDQLARTVNGVRVEKDGDSLMLRRGRDIVGEIPLCSNKRTRQDGDLLGQWIQELEQRR